MINWKVRFKNKQFWIAIIPAILVLIQMIAKLFGFELNLQGVSENLLDIVNSLFVVLALLGIVVDPTTAGVGDSEQALRYTSPRKG